MQKLALATHNRDKLKEIAALLSELNVELVAACDLIPGFEVVEDRDTILGNAAKKAIETAKALNLPALADDTGLFIEALNGEPGVLAARFAGKGCSYTDNVKKTLSLLNGITDRNAEFKTVVVLAQPDGAVAFNEGIVQGSITSEERGSSGFGYDPIFEIQGKGKTYAEMNETEKNECSHRGKAISNFIPFLKKYMEDK